MTCPYCNHTFPLTWGRYLKATTGRHICPRCFKPSRFEFRAFAFLVGIIFGAICSLPGAILLESALGGGWWVLGVIPSVPGIIAWHKWFDEKCKNLRAIEGEVSSDTAACVECNVVFNVQDMIAHNSLHVCARCKPVFLQKLAEGVKMGATPSAEPGRTRLVPFWFWLLLIIVALAAIVLALLFPITSHAPM